MASGMLPLWRMCSIKDSQGDYLKNGMGISQSFSCKDMKVWRPKSHNAKRHYEYKNNQLLLHAA